MYDGYAYGRRMGYGIGPPGDSSFIRFAEESSRSAFQSIEQIVFAVASVSQMLESTYDAMFSSFR